MKSIRSVLSSFILILSAVPLFFSCSGNKKEEAPPNYFTDGYIINKVPSNSYFEGFANGCGLLVRHDSLYWIDTLGQVKFIMHQLPEDGDFEIINPNSDYSIVVADHEENERNTANVFRVTNSGSYSLLYSYDNDQALNSFSSSPSYSKSCYWKDASPSTIIFHGSGNTTDSVKIDCRKNEQIDEIFLNDDGSFWATLYNRPQEDEDGNYYYSTECLAIIYGSADGTQKRFGYDPASMNPGICRTDHTEKIITCASHKIMGYNGQTGQVENLVPEDSVVDYDVSDDKSCIWIQCINAANTRLFLKLLINGQKIYLPGPQGKSNVYAYPGADNNFLWVKSDTNFYCISVPGNSINRIKTDSAGNYDIDPLEGGKALFVTSNDATRMFIANGTRGTLRECLYVPEGRLRLADFTFKGQKVYSDKTNLFAIDTSGKANMLGLKEENIPGFYYYDVSGVQDIGHPFLCKDKMYFPVGKSDLTWTFPKTYKEDVTMSSQIPEHNFVFKKSKIKAVVFRSSTDDATQENNFELQNKTPFKFSLPERSIQTDSAYQILLVLKTNPVGTGYVEIRADGVRFQKSILDAKWLTTLLIYLIIIVVVLSSQLFRSKLPPVSKWLPLLLFGGSATSSAFSEHLAPFIQQYLDPTLMIILLVATLPLLLLVGIIRPMSFKAIAQIAPFNYCLPLVSALPSFRRCFFKDYMTSFRKMIETEKTDEENNIIEKYAQIPCAFTAKSVNEIKARPVDELISTVQKNAAGNIGLHVSIVAPGGQGKSAFLREFLVTYHRLFIDNPSLPLPVYLNGTGKKISDIRTLLQRELGKYLLSEEMLDAEILAGKYMLIIDGLSEAEIEDNSIGDFVRSNNEAGSHTLLIATYRPNDLLKKQFALSENSLRVVPQKLDTNTISIFENSYLGKNNYLPESLRNICRSKDGSYQPILVRLAIITMEANISDITELYEAVFNRLLDRYPAGTSQQIRSDAAKLSKSSYWLRGSREVLSDPAFMNSIELLERSGIITPVSQPNQLGVGSKRFRFFHDSVQTYLTVTLIFEEIGRANCDQNKLRELFSHFLSNPLFTKDKTDFIFPGCEIYQMAVLYFERNGVDMKVFLRNELLHFADAFRFSFSVDNVINALPKHGSFAVNPGVDDNSMQALQKVIDLLGDDLHSLAEFFHNFMPVIREYTLIQLSFELSSKDVS